MSKWTLADIPSQAGNCAFITGANSGIGFHAARHLAGAGCAVILGCRDAKKGEAARQRIKQEFPTADVTVAVLDLASLASVRSCAASLLEAGKPLDLLIDNAGVMAFPTRQTTADGFERQFGTNHLGHFALTGLLLPLVLAAPAGRVVTVSSIAHGQGAMRFDDLQYTTGYEGWAGYNQSKLANPLAPGFALVYTQPVRRSADPRERQARFLIAPSNKRQAEWLPHNPAIGRPSRAFGPRRAQTAAGRPVVPVQCCGAQGGKRRRPQGYIGLRLGGRSRSQIAQ